MIEIINGTDYSFYPSTNQGVIRRLVNHPDIKPYLFLNPPDDFHTYDLKKISDPNLTIYIVRVENDLAGLGIFIKRGEHATVDNAFFPKYRGRHAKTLANLVILDYINRTSVRALKGKIRKSNQRSLVFAAWNNFKVISSDDTYYYVERECHGR